METGFSIEPSLLKILTSEGYIIASVSGSNDLMTISLKTPRTEKCPHQFIDNIKENLPLFETVYKFLEINFRTGKVIEDCSWLTVKMILKHGVLPIDTNKKTGLLLTKLKENGFTDFDDFVRKMTYVVRDLNIYNKISGDKLNKKKFYSFKRQWICFLSDSGLIERKIYEQKSQFDTLMLFTTKIDGITFHVREHDYIEKMSYYVGGVLEESKNSYIAKQYSEKDYTDIEFAKNTADILDSIYGNRYFVMNFFGVKK